MAKSAWILGAFLASGTAFAAPESLAKVDTAQGEILLEVQANGVAMTKIVKVSTACDLTVTAPTRPEAEKALADVQKEMRKGFDDGGLTKAVLDFSAPASTNNNEFPVPMAIELPSAPMAAEETVYDGSEMPAKGQYKPQIRIGKSVGVSVSSLQELEMAKALMGDLGCYENFQFTRRPNIETADSSAAQAEAKAKAIAAAKKQAEDYAAALGMRVVRIIRISETGAIREFLGPEADLVMQEMRRDLNRKQPIGNEVPVTASISVDYVLGPK